MRTDWQQRLGRVSSAVDAAPCYAAAAGKGSGGLGRMADPSQSSFATAYARQPRRVWPARVKSRSAEECEGSRVEVSSTMGILAFNGWQQGHGCGSTELPGKPWQHCQGWERTALRREGLAALSTRGGTAVLRKGPTRSGSLVMVRSAPPGRRRGRLRHGEAATLSVA